jgi:hypothetical protein
MHKYALSPSTANRPGGGNALVERPSNANASHEGHNDIIPQGMQRPV